MFQCPLPFASVSLRWTGAVNSVCSLIIENPEIKGVKNPKLVIAERDMGWRSHTSLVSLRNPSLNNYPGEPSDLWKESIRTLIIGMRVVFCICGYFCPLYVRSRAAVRENKKSRGKYVGAGVDPRSTFSCDILH